MGRWKRMGVLLGALAVSLLLTGCIGERVEDLYALPRQSDSYYNLQSAMDRVLPPDALYAGPLSGSNQQAVQLADLDGDETNEAIVFVRTTGEKPMNAYIFDQIDGNYENTAVLEGDGSAFDSVDYAQLDGRPGLELVIGRRLSDQILQDLTVYDYTDGAATELLSAWYTEYTVADLDGDDCRDLVVFRLSAEENGGEAELYRYRSGQVLLDGPVSMSHGATEITRILTGYVANGVPAVFVASAYGDETIVTDIFALAGNEFSNVSTNLDTGLSSQTIRDYHVYASDIDEDGVIELPSPVVLPSENAGDETFWIINWYNLTMDGSQPTKLTTFHNFADSWYVELPRAWNGEITIRRLEGQYGFSFSKWNGREVAPEEIFTIYGFTGPNRLVNAASEGRFLLAEKGDVAYAGSFGSCSWANSLTEEDLRAMFHFIHVDWNTGER